ncbi:MFS transporter [Arenibaculum pallidiluteum]|uniref:MFS transporter n=1 Tax=Arenibaculum pallidiluteum TaxID=2812559 RepID=UPI001A96A803|nr:MFS transporter [Arenibaculum pallidiluteum]
MPERVPPPAYPRATVRLLFALQLVSMGAMEMSGPFWPLHLREHSPSDWVFGLASVGVYVGPMLGIMLTSAFWGRVGDRFGNKLMMIRALLGLSATQLLLAFAADVWSILALRFLQGACAGYIAPAQAYGVQIEAPERRAQLFARLQIATNLGSVGGAVLGGLVLDRAPFAAINLAAGALCALCAATAWLALPEVCQRRGNSGGGAAPDDPAIADRIAGPSPVPGLLLLLGMLLASRLVMQAPFSLYVQEVFRADTSVTGLCYGLLALGFVVSASGWARVFSGRPAAEVLRGLSAVIAACALVAVGIGLTRTVAVFIALCFAWGALLAATTPVLTSLISAATAMHRQGRVLGVVHATQQFSSIVGIAIGMGFSQAFGLETIFFLVAALYLLSLGVATILRCGGPRGSAAPPALPAQPKGKVP